MLGVAEWVVFGRGSYDVGLLQCGGFACVGEFLVWGSFWCGGVAVCGNCGVEM